MKKNVIIVNDQRGSSHFAAVSSFLENHFVLCQDLVQKKSIFTNSNAFRVRLVKPIVQTDVK